MSGAGPGAARRAGSLRARLVVGAVLVAAVCVGVGDVVTWGLLRSQLDGRLDDQLVTLAAGPARRELAASVPAQRNGLARLLPKSTAGLGSAQLSSVPAASWTAAYSPKGVLLAETFFGDEPVGRAASDRRPELPASVRTAAANASSPRDASAQTGSRKFRVVTRRLAGRRTLVVAVTRDDVHRTLRRLARVLAVVTLVLLVAMAALVALVVGSVLGPLRRIERAAAAIDADTSAGLDARMPGGDARDEVGLLARSINGMLARLKGAFEQRESTERQLRRFVADASHELRTPLTTIQGYAELVQGRGDLPATERDAALAKVSREAARLGRLVDDLLSLSQLDRGHAPERAPLDLADVAAEAVDAARFTDPDREWALESEPTPFLGDADALRRLVDNLLANVRRHTPPGMPCTVTVAPLRTGGSPADGAVLEVRDAGAGLDDAQRAVATERFWRAEGSRAGASTGSGLGLAIVQAIALAHGGHVDLADAAPGLIVRVILPAS